MTSSQEGLTLCEVGCFFLEEHVWANIFSVGLGICLSVFISNDTVD